MADTLSVALAGLLRKAQLEGDSALLRDGIRVLAEALMEVEVAQHLGADKHERSAERVGYRNGDHEREWDTRAGTVDLHVPSVRDSSYFPHSSNHDAERSALWLRSCRRRRPRGEYPSGG